MTQMAEWKHNFLSCACFGVGHSQDVCIQYVRTTAWDSGRIWPASQARDPVYASGFKLMKNKLAAVKLSEGPRDARTVDKDSRSCRSGTSPLADVLGKFRPKVKTCSTSVPKIFMENYS